MNTEPCKVCHRLLYCLPFKYLHSSARPVLAIGGFFRSKICPNTSKRVLIKGVNYICKDGLAQSVERLTAEREVARSIPGAGPVLRVLK